MLIKQKKASFTLKLAFFCFQKSDRPYTTIRFIEQRAEQRRESRDVFRSENDEILLFLNKISETVQ